MTGIGENTLAQPVKPPLRERRACLAKLVKNRLTLTAGNALVRRLAVEGSWRYAQAGHQPKLMPKGSGVPLEVRMHGRKGSERLLRRREEMLARGMPQAKANAATAAELVRWLWALGAMCREATE